MSDREQIVLQASGFLHADQLIDAGRAIAVFSDHPAKRVQTRDQALEYCNSLLFWCLNNDRYEWAAQMLWGETLFSYKPRCTQLVWDTIKKYNSAMFMGAASMSKSYGCGVWLFLDWIRDPEYTSVNLVGPSEDHLKDNLFTHLVTLHRSSTLPLPGLIGDLFIGLDPKARKGAIRGIIIPIGKKPAGRLQGRKRVPRKTPHPQFGNMSRMRIFMDELEKIPLGVWKDVDNVFANIDADPEGFKLLAAFNPEDPNGQAAQRCEPVGGWEGFDPEKDEQWTSKRGWRVLRLDAARCENVEQQKVVFQGLQSWEGYNRIIQNAGGTDSPGYWTMARACFPRSGAVYSVIPTTLLNKFKADVMFVEDATPCGGVDLSLEGGDAAEFAVGKFGRAIGLRLPPNFQYPDGREIFFQDKQGRKVLRWVLLVEQIFPLTPGDTVAMANQVKSQADKFKIAPGWLMLDRTGNGAGVHDLLKSLWSEEVRGLNFSEGATKAKILEEDTKTAEEEYLRAVSEVWFALKKWGEFEFLKISPAAMSEELVRELGGRRYMSGKLTQVESKTDYKSRGNGSPNKADAVSLLLHGVRKASGVIPSATAESASANMAEDADHVPCVIDSTNRYEDLD